jgi:outer membrane lipoprotein-sorting protein
MIEKTVHFLAICVIFMSFTDVKASGCEGACCTKAVAVSENVAKTPVVPLTLEGVLAKLNENTAKLKSYQAEIKYLFIQDPELLDSRTLRTGKIYYNKEKDGSALRINFATLQMDDDDVEKQRQDFIFDGVWLTIVDYQLEKADKYQKSPKDKPLDVFEYISKHFPMIGFTKTDQLKKQFVISLEKSAAGDPKNTVRLKMKVRKDSIYKDKYDSIDFWADKKTFLPVRLKTKTNEEDVYLMEFSKAVANKDIKKSVFGVKIPKKFKINIESL